MEYGKNKITDFIIWPYPRSGRPTSECKLTRNFSGKNAEGDEAKHATQLCAVMTPRIRNPLCDTSSFYQPPRDGLGFGISTMPAVY